MIQMPGFISHRVPDAQAGGACVERSSEPRILRRVHIVVDTELREARHRQEEVEEEQEEKQDLPECGNHSCLLSREGRVPCAPSSEDSRLATDMAMSNSLASRPNTSIFVCHALTKKHLAEATFCRATSGLRFLKAADGPFDSIELKCGRVVNKFFTHETLPG